MRERRPHLWRMDDITDGWEHWSCHCGCGAHSSKRWHKAERPAPTRLQEIASEASR